jgi:hypothetical protein
MMSLYHSQQLFLVMLTSTRSICASQQQLSAPTSIFGGLPMVCLERRSSIVAFMPMQGFEAELPRAELQLSQSQADDIIKALKQLKAAVVAAANLVKRWSVSSRKGVWGAVQNFAFSKQDGQDLLVVSSCLSMHTHLCFPNLFALFSMRLRGFGG